MDERERRIGLNEAAFRAANERLEEMNLAFSQVSDRIIIVCVCGLAQCVEQIEMSLQEYEKVRSEPTHFAVRPGHEVPDVETVIEEHEGYFVVRKEGKEVEELAERTDPRS